MTLTQITEKGIKDGEIKNVDINTSAAIAGSKINPVSLADVGIGVSSPNVRLHQHIGTSGTNSHRFTNTTTGTGSTDGFILGLSGDEHVLLWNYENTPFRLATNSTERVRVTESGLVGIGTTSPAAPFHVYNATNNTIARLESGDATARLHLKDNSGEAFVEATGDNLIFSNTSSTTERMRVDSSGRLLIGGTSSQSQYSSQSSLQVQGTGFDDSTIALRRDQNNANPPGIIFAKSRSGSIGGSTIIQNGDQIGTLLFAAADGNDLTSLAAEIKVQIDGVPGSNDVPGRISLHTTSDGSSSPTERMRITKYGEVLIGKTTTSLSDDGLRLQGEGAINLSRTSTSTVLGTASGASIALVNPSATDNNFSNIGGYNSNSLVTSQINFINTNISNRHGAIAFMVHDGSVLAEKMRITKDARVLINTTSVSLSKTPQLEVKSSSNNSSEPAALFSSNNGSTAVGISYNTVDATNNTNNSDLIFATNGTERVRVTNGGLDPNGDGTTDLGNSSKRWRDLYLSSGVFLGGTGSSNELDDYEEGSWTPSVATGTAGGVGNARYVKIGRVVHVEGGLSNFSDQSSSTAIEITGFPFALTFLENAKFTCSLSRVTQQATGQGAIVDMLHNTSTAFPGLQSNSASTGTSIRHQDLNHNAASIIFSGTYTTN